MPTSQIFYDVQTTAETKKYSADLTAFLPSGGSAVSAAGSYAYQAGSPSGSCAAAITGGSIITLTYGPPTTTGVVYLYGAATLSDSEIRAVRWVVHVEW